MLLTGLAGLPLGLALGPLEPDFVGSSKPSHCAKQRQEIGRPEKVHQVLPPVPLLLDDNGVLVFDILVDIAALASRVKPLLLGDETTRSHEFFLFSLQSDNGYANRFHKMGHSAFRFLEVRAGTAYQLMNNNRATTE